MTTKPISITNAAEAKKFVSRMPFSHVKLGWVDHDGILRGKYIGKDKFLSALDNGFGFCDVVVGWDNFDVVYEEDAGVTYTGWHTAFPDMKMNVAVDTARAIPFEGGVPFFLCEAEDADICPRGVLKKVLKKADDMGFKVNAAFEYEFFLFNETPESVREKNYRNLNCFTPGNFGYSVLRSTVHSELYHDIINLCEAMDMPLEGIHTETGAGVLEAAIQVTDGLNAADRAVVFKTFVKALLQRREMMATFMAKWTNDEPGMGGHIHMSLTDKRGRSVFYDPNAPDGMSETMRHFVAGQRSLMPQMLAMSASTVNAFSRLVPGAWAPTWATWGVENRTCAIRVIKGSSKSQRVEYRIAAADANPYLALAASLASGLWGIEQKAKLAEPVTGNAYALKPPEELKLPMTLHEAAQRLRKSEIARGFFSDTFVDHFAAGREWEDRQFRAAITDWELKRYFEII